MPRVGALLARYCVSLPRADAARDQQYEAEATPKVPTLLMYTSPPTSIWQPNKCQSRGWIGICLCASATSAVRAKVLSPSLAFSRITRLRSAATGALSCSLIRVLRFTAMLLDPSRSTRAEVTLLVLSVGPESRHHKIGVLLSRLVFGEPQHLSSPALVVHNVFDFVGKCCEREVGSLPQRVSSGSP